MPENLRHAILSVRPDLSDARFSIAGRGWHSLAIDIDDRLIVKFPEGEEAIAALGREASMLEVIRPRVSIPVPDMRFHRTPRPLSMHGKLRGETMPAERYATLRPEARGRLAEDIACFFADLHALDAGTMACAGALPVDTWRTDEATLAHAWPELPPASLALLRAALVDYHALPPDPLGTIFGFFDAHGWNMAYDVEADRLAGVFDFADAGFAPLHREFVQPSLISPRLTLDVIDRYEASAGRRIDRRRVFLLTAAHRLSEFAGMVESAGDVAAWREAVTGWMDEAGRFGWSMPGKR